MLCLPGFEPISLLFQVADAVRTMSLLKAVKDKGVPLSIEASFVQESVSWVATKEGRKELSRSKENEDRKKKDERQDEGSKERRVGVDGKLCEQRTCCQAYRLRLDVLLRVRGRRRSIDQIHRALAA